MKNKVEEMQYYINNYDECLRMLKILKIIVIVKKMKKNAEDMLQYMKCMKMINELKIYRHNGEKACLWVYSLDMTPRMRLFVYDEVNLNTRHRRIYNGYVSSIKGHPNEVKELREAFFKDNVFYI